jgi:hypothetical protein
MVDVGYDSDVANARCLAALLQSGHHDDTVGCYRLRDFQNSSRQLCVSSSMQW